MGKFILVVRRKRLARENTLTSTCSYFYRDIFGHDMRQWPARPCHCSGPSFLAALFCLFFCFGGGEVFNVIATFVFCGLPRANTLAEASELFVISCCWVAKDQGLCRGIGILFFVFSCCWVAKGQDPAEASELFISCCWFAKGPGPCRVIVMSIVAGLPRTKAIQRHPSF